jgi:hypothetical protein
MRCENNVYPFGGDSFQVGAAGAGKFCEWTTGASLPPGYPVISSKARREKWASIGDDSVTNIEWKNLPPAGLGSILAGFGDHRK